MTSRRTALVQARSGFLNASSRLSLPRDAPMTIIDIGMVAPESEESTPRTAVGTGTRRMMSRMPSRVAISGMLNMSRMRRPFPSPLPFRRHTP